VRRVLWTDPAQTAADDYLAFLRESDPGAAARASEDIRAAGRRLAVTRTPGRPSLRWPGWRELSLMRWSKLIVFRMMPDRISVDAFVDTRRDLDSFEPIAE
jgi:plasmid stabilization system protein ParE